MKKILHIVASPRGKASQSTSLAEAYIAAETHTNPGSSVDVLDLWKEELPEFDGDKAAAKMTFFGVGDMNVQYQTAWDQVVAITERFTSVDLYVFSVPMWNGGIPYKLKQYIDIITQPGLLFGFDPDAGYSGLLRNKTARVFYTSGVFAPGAPAKYGADYHSSYLSWWLDFVGISEQKTVRFQPSLLTEDPESARLAALQQSKALAKIS